MKQIHVVSNELGVFVLVAKEPCGQVPTEENSRLWGHVESRGQDWVLFLGVRDCDGRWEEAPMDSVVGDSYKDIDLAAVERAAYALVGGL